MPEPMVNSVAVPERLYRPGRQMRALILADLASRWERHELPPSERKLAIDLKLKRGQVRYHLEGLREDGLIHGGMVWLTRAGFEAARNPTKE